MQVDVRQQRGNHPTLRSPSNRPLDTLLGQHTCSQPLTDQFQHPPIRNPPPNLAHEHLMVKVVEKNPGDRKSTRLNSSHVAISYAVSCLKKQKSGCTRPTTHP